MNRTLRALGLALGATMLLMPGVRAQTSGDEEAVLAVLERLFNGMRTHDGDLLRSVFADGAVLIRTEGREGEPATTIGPVTGFIDAISSATAELDEPIWDPIIQIQDHLATVWAKFAFYLDGDFSHCGIDTVILARSPDGWKIAALADTRETENCELPPGR